MQQPPCGPHQQHEATRWGGTVLKRMAFGRKTTQEPYYERQTEVKKKQKQTE